MKKRINKIIGHPLFSGSAIMIFGSNSASGLNYLYHLITGRLLGPSLYGELAALISTIGLLGIIPGAFNLVIVKQISSTKEGREVSNLIRWFKTKIFLVSLIFSIFVLISSPIISSYLRISRPSYFLIIAFFLLFSLQSGFNRSILQGLLKFKEMVISIIAENGAKLVLSIFLIYMGFQIEGALLAFLISSFLGLFVTYSFLKNNKASMANFSPDTNSMLVFTVPVIIQTIAVTSLYTTDVILVKHFFSSHDAGIYASLSTLAKIIFFATGPIGAVMFPLVSQRKAQGKDFRKIFNYSFLATGLFALGSLLIYWLVPNVVINLLYGSAYLEAERLLIWFGLFISLFTLSSLLISYNLSLGKTRVTFLPLFAATLQIMMIVLFHQTLFIVIIISASITALLLLSLLVYSSYVSEPNISHSSSF